MTFVVNLALIVLGFGAGGWWALRSVRGANPSAFMIRNGAWRSSTVVGSPAADAWTRARVALTGILALTRSESVYFTAERDQAGAPLSGDAVYELAVPPLPARWWSITLYGPDYFLIDNVEARYSVLSGGIAPGADGMVRFRVGRDPGPEGLPSGNAPTVILTLRLYHLPEADQARLETLPLPTIARVGR